MPVMSGEQTFNELSRINPDVPVILSSGFDQSEAARRFSGLKPALFLQKPYTVERLTRAITEALIARKIK
jgi:DNA-binding NtrC family response regulator